MVDAGAFADVETIEFKFRLLDALIDLSLVVIDTKLDGPAPCDCDD